MRRSISRIFRPYCVCIMISVFYNQLFISFGTPSVYKSNDKQCCSYYGYYNNNYIFLTCKNRTEILWYWLWGDFFAVLQAFGRFWRIFAAGVFGWFIFFSLVGTAFNRNWGLIVYACSGFLRMFRYTVFRNASGVFGGLIWFWRCRNIRAAGRIIVFRFRRIILIPVAVCYKCFVDSVIIVVYVNTQCFIIYGFKLWITL